MRQGSTIHRSAQNFVACLKTGRCPFPLDFFYVRCSSGLVTMPAEEVEKTRFLQQCPQTSVDSWDCRLNLIFYPFLPESQRPFACSSHVRLNDWQHCARYVFFAAQHVLTGTWRFEGMTSVTRLSYSDTKLVSAGYSVFLEMSKRDDFRFFQRMGRDPQYTVKCHESGNENLSLFACMQQGEHTVKWQPARPQGNLSYRCGIGTMKFQSQVWCFKRILRASIPDSCQPQTSKAVLNLLHDFIKCLAPLETISWNLNQSW